MGLLSLESSVGVSRLAFLFSHYFIMAVQTFSCGWLNDRSLEQGRTSYQREIEEGDLADEDYPNQLRC